MRKINRAQLAQDARSAAGDDFVPLGMSPISAGTDFFRSLFKPVRFLISRTSNRPVAITGFIPHTLGRGSSRALQRLGSQAAGTKACSAFQATPRIVTSSRTEAADFSSAAFSSAVSLISMICSTPRAPSFTGTPTYNPLMPYSPSR